LILVTLREISSNPLLNSLISRQAKLILLETLRQMVNEVVRIGFQKKPKKRFKLTSEVYEYFQRRLH